MRKTFAIGCVLGAVAVAWSADALTGIVDPYLRIQTALVNDRLGGIKADAEVIAAEGAKLGTAAGELQAAAKELVAATDLKGARTAFGKLSDALLKYAETMKSSIGPDVKVAYCPMVDKSWVQKGDKIANPYFGQSMPTCGEFKSSRE